MSHTANFPRKAFETACHAMGVLEQNREYLQFHLKNADEKTQQALADMQQGRRPAGTGHERNGGPAGSA